MNSCKSTLKCLSCGVPQGRISLGPRLFLIYEFMLIASRRKLSQFMKCPSLSINENAIEQVTSAKSLGVYVDQIINWECYIENISKKIGCAIGVIKRIRHLTPFDISMKVYNSLVRPHFDYCNVVCCLSFLVRGPSVTLYI